MTESNETRARQEAQVQLDALRAEQRHSGLCLSAALRGQKRNDEPFDRRLDAVRALVAERDALDAKVARLIPACQLAIDMMIANDCDLPKTFEIMRDAMGETPSTSLDALKAQVTKEAEKREARYWWSLGMANARRFAKSHKSWSNAKLFMELFGTGMGTARARCRDIGLDPDGNQSPLHGPSIRQTKEGE